MIKNIPIKKVIRELKATFTKTGEPPQNIVWFLTEKCNLRCKHCFVNNANRKAREEFSTQEIKKFIEQNKSWVKHVNLTGGEPMIRQDIEEILKALHKNNISVSISTNGFNYKKLVEIIKGFYPQHVDNFHLQTSLDGSKEIHNKIRQNPTAFDNAIGLIELAKKENIPISAVMTVSKYNHPHLDYVIELTERYKIPLLLNFIRTANDVQKGAKNDFVPVEKNDLTLDEIHLAIKKWEASAKNIMTYSNLITNKARMYTVVDFIKHSKWFYPCTAGMAQAVMFCNGDIAVCEMLKPLGNIKNHDFSWKKFWHKFPQKEKYCFCQYDCAMLDSMTKSSKGWLYLLWQMLK